MKKIFRLAIAEFNKIFYRPSIFILTALLIAALVASGFMFKPTTNTTKLNYASNNVEGIYSIFVGSSKLQKMRLIATLKAFIMIFLHNIIV